MLEMPTNEVYGRGGQRVVIFGQSNVYLQAENNQAAHALEADDMEHAWLPVGEHPNAELTVKMDKATLDRISLRQLDFPTAIKQGLIKLDGNGKRFGELLGLLDTFEPQFNIVTP
ncbi:hypothetical protein D9M71_241550 [compost metagenome]